jgi:hypothetical protein
MCSLVPAMATCRACALISGEARRREPGAERPPVKKQGITT